MTPTKRLFDLAATFFLLIPLAPVMIITALLILLLDGAPIFYISQRMKGVGRPFRLIKFRTMRQDGKDFGASGGHKSHRITKSGAFLRKTRLDEVPQIWNILRGDMSFVGPRPPLPVYVEQFPDIYARVLENRPGVTGLASVYFHRHEDFLLRSCHTSDENETIYTNICIPRKARLDMIYQSKRNICFDIKIMLMTIFKTLR